MENKKRLTEYGKFHKGGQIQKKKLQKKLAQSIKSLTEKVKENPNWGEGRGGQENVEFFHIPSVFNF